MYIVNIGNSISWEVLLFYLLIRYIHLIQYRHHGFHHFRGTADIENTLHIIWYFFLYHLFVDAPFIPVPFFVRSCYGIHDPEVPVLLLQFLKLVLEYDFILEPVSSTMSHYHQF